MKEKRKIENAKLGILVLSGTLFLVFTLYMIGKNQNIFGASFTITSVVDNVNGLVPGNNVRFKGIDVGTVKSIEIANDSLIYIHMYVHKKMQPFIKKNAMTSINTDGLMGNKIIQIIPQQGESEPVEEGDIIYALTPLDTDAMLKRLEGTGEYLEITFLNLSEIAEKLNKSENLWNFLNDPELTDEIKSTIKELRRAGSNASQMAAAGKEMIQTFEQGDGIMKRAFTDSLMADNIASALEKIVAISQEMSVVAEDVKKIVEDIEAGEGTAGLILTDSLMRESLMNTMMNIEAGTANFNQNMEALKSSFLLRKYFRKLEEEKMYEEQEKRKASKKN
ncbi:MlaD family protein [Shivajiella indica]|uniref:MlaD family protein n=1 Tax=Shivajiella indica TaxID=872115 RepID=A0ABW5B5T3_9BACT